MGPRIILTALLVLCLCASLGQGLFFNIFKAFQNSIARERRRQQIQVNALANSGMVVQHRGVVYNRHLVPDTCFVFDLRNWFDQRCFADCPFCRRHDCKPDYFQGDPKKVEQVCTLRVGTRVFLG